MSEQRALDSQTRAPVTPELASFAASIRYEDLSAEVRTFAKHCFMDWFGVTLAGSADETSLLVLAEAREQGGNPQATIVGHGDRTSVLQAALVNGTFSHALDYDDVNGAMNGHPTVTVAPAVLALAERDGFSGKQILEAFAAGVDVECRIGRLLTMDHYARGFHTTGTVGTIGAAAASARLLGLDGAQTATALGIAATQAAGLKSMFGTMCKPLHAGKAAANGLYGALMAKRGFTANGEVLDCDQGFGVTHTGEFDFAGAVEELGERYYTPEILFKYHAACYGTHATIEAAKRLRDRHGLTPERVQSYEVKVPLPNLRMCDIQKPTTGLEAKFSLRMTAAMALAGENTAAVESYSEALCRKPELVALIDRAKIVGDAGQGQFQAEVTVRTTDGLVLREQADAGLPETDLKRQQSRLEQKFDAIVEPVVGAAKARRLKDAVLALDELNGVSELMAECAP